MHTLPLVRASAISPIIKFLDQAEVPVHPYLNQVNLPETVLDEPEALISLLQAFSFVDQVAHGEGIETLGILASQQLQVSHMGLFGTVLGQSLTGYDLLQSISQLLTTTYSSGARTWLTQDSERVWLNHHYAMPAHLDNQQVHYYVCLAYARLAELIAGPDCRPTDLHFQARELPGLSQLELFSAVRVRFNQPHNAMGFAKRFLYLPIKEQRIIRSQVNPNDVYERLQTTAPATDSVGLLRQFIQGQLSSGHLQIDVAAAASGVSVRSLQRQLDLEGLNYSRLVDQVRFGLAVELLKDPTLQMVDIAFELGYTKPANFTRAFQRWAGVTPREFRRLHSFG